MNNDSTQPYSSVNPEWEDRLIDFAFGAMNPEGLAAFERELDECTAYVALARQYRNTIAMLGTSVPSAEPPEGHKDRFIAKLANTAQGGGATEAGSVVESNDTLRVIVGGRRPIGERDHVRQNEAPTASAQEERIVDLMQARSRRQASILAPVMAVAAVLALLVMGAWLWTTNSALGAETDKRVAAEQKAGSEQMLRLAAEQKLTQFAATLNVPAGYTAFQIQPQGTNKATATVLYNPGTRDASLLAAGLSPLAPGKVYEFWLLPADPNALPLPAGTFTAEASGIAKHTTLAPSNVGNYAGFAVTLEDAPGAQTPQGPKILAGNF